jgi:hypothetical protein
MLRQHALGVKSIGKGLFVVSDTIDAHNDTAREFFC